MEGDNTQIIPAETIVNKIGTEQIDKANAILKKYKDGKANLENRITRNEEWWRLRHWNDMEAYGGEGDPQPASAWLFNCIISKHADGIEAYPTFNCLPREEDDKGEAENLSNILPVVLQQNNFEDVYSEVLWQKLKSGTGIYGVFWDANKLNGLGDISINKIDVLNIFWEPGISNIQKSRNIFVVELVDNELLEQMYPQLQGNLANDTLGISKYRYDDNVDTTEKSLVVDWYYKVNVGGKQVLHFCKYVGNTVISATENDPNMVEGLYDHGEYPFVFDTLFPIEGSPCGFGYVDVAREPQKYIDVLGQSILKSAGMGATPRYFVREDGGINEAEFADWTKPFIHVAGDMSDNSIKPIDAVSLPPIAVEVMRDKIDELKETTGNRDVNNGGSVSGVTAASAIAAMQEQSGKTSKDSTKAAYRSYEKIVELCVELVRQFYTMPRKFRIVGKYGKEEFTSYSNTGLQPQDQGQAFGSDMGFRKPVFDLEISAQKESPYNKLSQNELALQFFQLGFFDPANSDQVLACLDMMDFNHKSSVMQKISENGTLYDENVMLKQQLLQFAQMLDQLQGTNMSEQVAMQVLGQAGQVTPMQASPQPQQLGAIDSTGTPEKKSAVTENARAKAQQATQPN